MRKMGLPLGAITQKMRMNSVDEQLISAFQMAESGGAGRSPTNARAPSSAQFGNKAVDNGPKYHEDAQFAKYLKMTKIGNKTR
jgi:hypothetical protein